MKQRKGVGRAVPAVRAVHTRWSLTSRRLPSSIPGAEAGAAAIAIV